MHDKNKEKIPYKLFATVVSIVAIITFFIMNYNPVSVTFIFFTIKVPLTLLFFICMILGIFITTIYWKNKYKKLKNKFDRVEKLLFSKENLEKETKVEKQYIEEEENGFEV